MAVILSGEQRYTYSLAVSRLNLSRIEPTNRLATTGRPAYYTIAEVLYDVF